MKLQSLSPDDVGNNGPEPPAFDVDALSVGSRFNAVKPVFLVPAPTAPPDCKHPGIVRIIAMIREEYSRPLTVSSLARECGMSVRSLHRHYREITGTTIGRDLVARRLEAAAEMLREDDVKLESVAMETGLRDAKNLCRLFRRHIGITPGQLKESVHDQTALTT